MGRPPVLVIIARYAVNSDSSRSSRILIILFIRHGARLDAADAQWHLTSPTPYDPPLTYGGWRQSQALGARIASIIHSREAAASPQTSNGPRPDSEQHIDGEGGGHRRHHSHRSKRRKHKVLIHSSPYLRCIQTSVAISAGIAQSQESQETSSHVPRHVHHAMHSGSPHIRALENRDSPHLSAITEPGASGKSDRKSNKSLRPALRIDAFLGEWLSPDYFDKITPPPESKLMVAHAKADLSRRGDPVEIVCTSDKTNPAKGYFPGGWGSGTNTALQSSDEETPVTDMSSLSKELPRLGRANSHSHGLSPGKRSGLNLANRVDKSPVRDSKTYVPPTPSYAISPSQPIPQGYVAHARDACIKVDYKWDSLRPPLEWGNGGDYGESWSSMHKRFRRGLQEMLSWYRNHSPNEMSGEMDDESQCDSPDVADDDETDTVLVLVTHGAGCNALIGALTNQPVLINVGMASLTMAIRKTVDYTRVASPTDPNPPTSPSRRRRSVIDLGLSDDYEVKVTASTDHLRAGSQYLAGTQLRRTATMPIRDKSPYRYERPGFESSHPLRFTAVDEDEDDSGSDKVTPTKNKRVEETQNDAVTTPAMPPAGGSGSGLWTKPVTPKIGATLDTDSDLSRRISDGYFPTQIPQMNGAADTPNTPTQGLRERPKSSTSNSETRASDNDLRDRSIVSAGLWGAPPQALGTERDLGAKRRWTLSQAS